jgi:hypothetical protein
MKTKNYWPMGITATLLLFFLGTVSLIVMACRQSDDLVTNNYYEDEIRYQKQIDRETREQHLESKATAAYDAIAGRLMISLPARESFDKVQGQIQLYRPSDAQLDRNFALKPDAIGRQVIDVAELQRGLWLVKVSWSAGGADYYFDQKIVVKAAKL